ncbi:MAG: hypothetical protein ACKV2V_08485 [Blastocatellia bacterium]
MEVVIADQKYCQASGKAKVVKAEKAKARKPAARPGVRAFAF